MQYCRTYVESGSPAVCICADAEAGGLLPIQALPSNTQVKSIDASRLLNQDRAAVLKPAPHLRLLQARSVLK